MGLGAGEASVSGPVSSGLCLNRTGFKDSRSLITSQPGREGHSGHAEQAWDPEELTPDLGTHTYGEPFLFADPSAAAWKAK